MNLRTRVKNRALQLFGAGKSADNALFDHSGWEVFTFGDPTPVMQGRDILDYLHSWHNGQYYEPPINLRGLYKSLRASPYHSGGIYVKRNVLASTLESGLLTHSVLDRATLDAGIYGNAFLRRKESRTGKLLGFEYLPALHTRVMTEEGRCCYIGKPNKVIEFGEGEVFHYVDPDAGQELYGLPEYLAALQSAWLNESATLFRRKYYENGSHAGFILYMTDAAQEEQDIHNLRKALKESKGPGNFRNLLMYAPNGKKDGIQILPISEVSAKDDFWNIKNVSRDDVLAGHRVPPQMMSIVPNNTGGFGAADTAAEVFFRNEIVPLQTRWKALNDWAGQTVVEFGEYKISNSGQKSD